MAEIVDPENPSHPMDPVDGLAPKTTYYYKVDSVNASGASDRVPSPVKTFMTK